MTREKTTLLLGLGRGAAARQLERTCILDERFKLAGSHGAFAELHAALDACDEPPDVVLICDALEGHDLEDAVADLSEQFATRVMVLHDTQRSALTADTLTRAGAVHVEQTTWPQAQLDTLPDAIVQRILRRVQTMASVSILKRPRRRRHGSRGTHSVTQLLARLELSASQTPATPSEPIAATTAEPSFASDGTPRRRSERFDLIGIASSTGGQEAVQRVISDLPSNFSVPIVLIQHIGAGHDLDLARELRNRTTLSVLLIEQACPVEVGRVYVSPSGRHVEVSDGPRLVVKEEPRDALYRPSADIFFHSMARALGPRGIGVVLTGMGDDGARGLLAMKQMGATTLVQDRRSSQIFGMPRAAIDLGAATEIQPLEAIGLRLRALCSR